MSATLVDPARATPSTRARGTSFAGLVGVELRRLWWRRLTKVVVLAMIAFVGVMTYGAYTSSTPETLAQRLDQYQQMVRDSERQQQEMQAQLPQMIEQCRKDEAAERERSGDPSITFGCEQMGNVQTPSMEDMGIVPPVADTITSVGLSQGAFVFAFLALVLLGSFAAAEFSTGAMGNWLTFQPRRVRVALSKLAAAVVGSALLAALGIALINLGARAIATINRPGSDLQLPEPPALAQSVPELMLRCVALAILAGVLGAALGLILRHTAAIIGTVLAWGVVVEGILVNNLLQGRLHPWAAIPNATAFINKTYTYYAESCTATRCEYAERTLSYTHGWVYLIVAGVAIATVAVLVFRRRDVT